MSDIGTESVATESRPKRQISPEHLARLAEGRRRAHAERKDREVKKRERSAQGRARIAQTVQKLAEASVDDEPWPQPVVLAEVKATTEAFWPMLLEQFPNAQPQMIRGQLALATRGIRQRLLRTPHGLALFDLLLTPWEPLFTVSTVFVVGKTRDREVLMAAGERWARQVGAAYFERSRKVDRIDLRSE